MTLPGCVMAEIAYSTEHAHREVLAWSQVTLCWYVCLNFTMKALAAAALGVRWSNVMVMLWLHYGYVVATAMAAASVRRGCVTAAASVRREAASRPPRQSGEAASRPPRQSGEGLRHGRRVSQERLRHGRRVSQERLRHGRHVSQERGCVTAAASVRREQTRLQHLWLLRSPSRLSAHASPTLGSVNSEDSGDGKTIGITDRISETSSVLCSAIMKLELCILHWSIISCVS